MQQIKTDLSTIDKDPPTITVRDLATLLNLLPSVLLANLRRGLVPKPDLELGQKGKRWRKSTIKRWLKAGGLANA